MMTSSLNAPRFQHVPLQMGIIAESDFRGVVGYAGAIKSYASVNEFSPPDSPTRKSKIGAILKGGIGYAGFITVIPNGVQDIIDNPGSPPQKGKKSLGWIIKEFYENPDIHLNFEDILDREINASIERPPELIPFCISSSYSPETQTLSNNAEAIYLPPLDEYIPTPQTPKKRRKNSSQRHLSVSYSEENEIIEKAKLVNFSTLGTHELANLYISPKYLPDGIVDEKWAERQSRRKKRLDCTRRYRMLESLQHFYAEVPPISGGLPKMQSIKWITESSNDQLSSWLRIQSLQEAGFVKSTSLEKCRSLSNASSSSPTLTYCHSDSLSPQTPLKKGMSTSGFLHKRKSLPMQSPNEVKSLVGWGEKTIPQFTYEAQLPMRQNCMSDRLPTLLHNSEEDNGFIFMRLLNIFQEDLVDLLEVLTRKHESSASPTIAGLCDSPNYQLDSEGGEKISLMSTPPNKKAEFKSLRSLERPESRVKPIHPRNTFQSSTASPQQNMKPRMCANNTISTGYLVQENDREIALFRVGDLIFATDSKCPHAGGPLEVGDIENLYDGDCVIRCPWHGFKFNLFKSGEVVHPLSRKNDLRLHTYPVKIDETGSIYIGFDCMSQCWFDSTIQE